MTPEVDSLRIATFTNFKQMRSPSRDLLQQGFLRRCCRVLSDGASKASDQANSEQLHDNARLHAAHAIKMRGEFHGSYLRAPSYGRAP